MYRLDAYDEPSSCLKRERVTLKIADIASGDYLCLKSDEFLFNSEKMFFTVFHSLTGDPD